MNRLEQFQNLKQRLLTAYGEAKRRFDVSAADMADRVSAKRTAAEMLFDMSTCSMFIEMIERELWKIGLVVNAQFAGLSFSCFQDAISQSNGSRSDPAHWSIVLEALDTVVGACELALKMSTYEAIRSAQQEGLDVLRQAATTQL